MRALPRVLRIAKRMLGAMTLLTVAYLLVLVFPQPLFAYSLEHEGIVLRATRPIPSAMRERLAEVRDRLRSSGIDEPSDVYRVYLCDSPWLFALFARGNYRVGGVADVFVSRNVFLRESDMANNRLIGPSGQPVAPDRPLSYFIAHEMVHIAHGRRLGRIGYARLPRWVDEGHADAVAREIDLGAALDAFKAGARELDPARSGLYIRYQLLVSYLLQKQQLGLATLLASPPPQSDVERDVAALASWPE